VQEKNRRTVLGPRLDHVQTDLAGVEKTATAAFGKWVGSLCGVEIGGWADARSLVGFDVLAVRQLESHPAPTDVTQPVRAFSGQSLGDEAVDLPTVFSGAAQRLADRRRHSPAVAAANGDLDVGEYWQGFDHHNVLTSDY
jgi:hypothetical protein